MIKQALSKDLLLLSLLMFAGLSMTGTYMYFATALGFNVYLESQIALFLCLLLAVFLIGRFGPLVWGRNTVLHRTMFGLGVVLVLTFLLRVFFALNASLFPDEYWVLLVLRDHPLRNLGYFFANYVSITQRYASHPPLALLMMSVAYEIVPTATSARLVSVMLGTATVGIVYYVMRELGVDKYALPVAALYGFFPHTLLYLSVALTDVYMNFFGLLSLLLGLKSLRLGRAWYFVPSGIALGMSLLSKQGLGIFWGILLLLATFTVRPKAVSFLGAFGKASLSLILGLGIFSLWYFGNTGAFLLTVLPIIHYVLTVPSDPQAYNVGECCFGPVNGMLAHISYPDLIVQLPVWLSPLGVLMALVGVGVSLRRRSRKDAWWVLWGVGPLLAMIPGIRDIRYALFIGPAVAFLAWLGLSRLNRRIQRPAIALMMIFVIMFVSVTAAVAQQQYWGVQEASAEITRLGYGSGVVLTNVPEVMYTLPHAELVLFYPHYNLTQVIEIIIAKNVTAVIVIHNERAPWATLPTPVTNGMRGIFSGYDSSAISAFASYEIFYGRG